MTGVVISAPPAAAAISAPDPGVVEAAAADDPADVCPEGVALPDVAAAAAPLIGDTGTSLASSASTFFFFFAVGFFAGGGGLYQFLEFRFKNLVFGFSFGGASVGAPFAGPERFSP